MKFKILKIIFFSFVIILFKHNDAKSIETILKVAFQPDSPPYQFVDGYENLGVHIELLNKIANQNNFIISYIPVESVSEGIEKLNEGNVDIVLGVNSSIDFGTDVQLTENISQSYICIFTTKEKSEDIQENLNLKYYSAGLEDGIIKYSYIQNMRKLRFVVTSNQVDAFNMLKMDKIDMLIGVKHSVLYQMEKDGYDDQFIIINNYIAPIQYTMAIRKNNTDLLNKLNKSIREMRIYGDYDDIHDKWINEDNYALKELIRKVSFYIVGGLVLTFSIFIISVILNVYLKRQVNEKTKELREINIDLQNQIIKTRNYNELNNYIIENSPNGIVVFDTNYIINLCNYNAVKLMKSNKSLIGSNVFDVEILRDIVTGVKDNIFYRNFNMINQNIDLTDEFDEVTNYKYSIYQLFSSNEEVRGLVLTIEDITNENRMRRQFYEQEKNKALNRIIASIAHEIRNPLMSIKTFVQLIPKKFKEKQFRDQLSYFVPKEVDRVNILITNLIDYAKPANYVKENLSLDEIIESSYVLLKPYMENKNIQFNMDLQKDLNVTADKNKLKQVIINIILNAFESVQEKYDCTEADRTLKINVKAWKDKKSNFVEVYDDGVGMTEEEIKKSTELFYTTKILGTGLGLTLSKQYAEENGGSLSIESVKNDYTKITLEFGS